jgi:hypothetical protein
MAALCVLLAESNMRDVTSVVVLRTDATATTGGSVTAAVHPEVAEVLYDFGEHRGEHVRPEASPDALRLRPTQMMEPTFERRRRRHPAVRGPILPT